MSPPTSPCEADYKRIVENPKAWGLDREAVDPITGICTWKALAMDKEIDVLQLCKAKHKAEAYHTGDKSQHLVMDWKGYLAEKYPLVEEYKQRKGVVLWDRAFHMAVLRDEKANATKEAALYEKLYMLEGTTKDQTKHELLWQPSNQGKDTQPYSSTSYKPGNVETDEDLISFD